jgi:hypothetical protein
MMSLVLLVVALVASYAAARRSLVRGLAVVLTVGYAYGIVRANRLDGYSHLLFDAALLGLYAGRLFAPMSLADRARTDELRTWLIVLMGWPVLLFFVPRQDLLVELVGLRGNIFMLPCLLLGARLSRDEMYSLAGWLAVLNIGAAGVAAAQFVLGIEPFFPRNPVTEIIYRSGDIAGFTAHRIPSSFTSAHAYAGTMVTSLPILIGAWMQPSPARWVHWMFGTAITASALAVFTTGARLPVVLLLVVASIALLSGRVQIRYKLRWLAVAAMVAWAVSGEERLQRFLTLQDTEYVAERIAGSVDLDFMDLARTYPLGNGLGGGGTSIPYFLQSRVRNSVAMENEYARIVLEQGIPGLCAWILFLAWVFTRNPSAYPSWALSRRLMRAGGAAAFASGMLGIGLLTSIPSTALLLLTAGWIAVPERIPEPARSAQQLASFRLTSA